MQVKEATNSSEWDFKDAETSLNDLSERRVRRFNKGTSIIFALFVTYLNSTNHILFLNSIFMDPREKESPHFFFFLTFLCIQTPGGQKKKKKKKIKIESRPRQRAV